MFFARRLPREEVYVTFGYIPILDLAMPEKNGIDLAITLSRLHPLYHSYR